MPRFTSAHSSNLRRCWRGGNQIHSNPVRVMSSQGHREKACLELCKARSIDCKIFTMPLGISKGDPRRQSVNQWNNNTESVVESKNNTSCTFGANYILIFCIEQFISFDEIPIGLHSYLTIIHRISKRKQVRKRPCSMLPSERRNRNQVHLISDTLPDKSSTRKPMIDACLLDSWSWRIKNPFPPPISHV